MISRRGVARSPETAFAPLADESAPPPRDNARPARANLLAISYRVRPGDTLDRIARSHGISPTSILWNNPAIRDPDTLPVGSTLRIPGRDGVLYTVVPGDTVSAIAARFKSTVTEIRGYPGNRLARADELLAGSEILVPGGRPPDTRSPSEPDRHSDRLPEGSAYTTTSVNLRGGPGVSFAVLTTIASGSPVWINGPPEAGFYPVTFGSLDGWASGEYLSEGAPPADTPEPPALPGIGTDDYPYGPGVGLDPWGFALANCTSFVAWRLNHTLGVPFDAYAFGGYWGDAGYWDSAAAVAGLRVDDLPSVGAIAQWRGDETVAGFGHVGVVVSVNADGSANIEEYNALVPLGYSRRTLFAPRYIHFSE